MEDILQTTILLLGVALFIVAAYGDVKKFQISNKLTVAVAVLGLVRLLVIGNSTGALYVVGASVAVFIVTFLLFWRGLVGGGDAKLMTATTLLVGYHDLFHFLMLMSLCGLLVSLAVLVARRRSPQPGSQPKARLSVPYGAAIAGGAIATLLFQPPLLG